MELSPIAVRSLEQQQEFKQSAGVQIIELRLPWIQKESYPSYRAEVRRVDGDESFIFPILPAENGLSVVRLRLRTQILSRGQYQVRLSGIDSGGVAGTTEEYAFTVDGR
jgi:hypothetical protein